MDRLRFHLDEDCQASALVAALREHGVDVLTTNESGLSGVEDEAQLAHATEKHRVLVTNNLRDFVPLHARWVAENRRPHAGIVLFGQQTLSIGETVRRLVRLSRSRSPEEMWNRLEWLNSWAGA